MSKSELKEFMKTHYPEFTEEKFNELPFVKSIRDEVKKECIKSFKSFKSSNKKQRNWLVDYDASKLLKKLRETLDCFDKEIDIEKKRIEML